MKSLNDATTFSITGREQNIEKKLIEQTKQELK